MQSETRGQGTREGGRAEGQSDRTMDRGQAQRGQAQKDQAPKGQTIGQGKGGSDQPRRSEDKSDRDRAQRDKTQKDQTIGQSKRDSDQPRRSEGGQKEAPAAQTQQQDRSRAGTQGQTTGQSTTQRQQGTQAPQQQQDRAGTATQGQGTTGAATQNQSGADTQSQTSTTAQNQASRATLSAQQQTTIRQSVLSARNAPRVNVNSINFAINAGVVVPSHVNVVAVSAFPVLIDIVPDFRDDSFFVVDDEIVILDRSRRVVDVVPAGPRTHFSRNFSRSGVGGGAAASLNLSVTEIREVQQVLIDRGFLTGQVDGVFNDRTRQALISFQRREGIQASGSIDSRTVSSLGLSNKIGEQSNQST